MEITLDVFQLFDLMAFTTAFILGLVFLFKSPKANIYLALFLICLGIEVFQSFYTDVSIKNSFSLNEFVLFSLPSLVFLLFYIQKNILGKIPQKALFVLLIGLVITFIMPFFTQDIDSIIYRFLDYIFNLSIIIYLFKTLQKHQKDVINYYSELEQKTLSWTRAILYIMLGFYILWIVEDIIGLFNKELPQIFALISTIATCALIYWIGYKGLSQPEIFNQSLYKENNIEPDNNSSQQNEVIIIEEEQNDLKSPEDLDLFNNLKEQIVNQKLYINQQLNLRSLAINLNLNEKELSRIINTQTNFYQLINSLRVKEFKKLVQSPKASQLSLLGLAQEAGFSSKSTFYTAFKKIEGMTPKQYENSLK